MSSPTVSSMHLLELETGLLPMSGVSGRLREALVERFGDAVQAALVWEPPRLEADLSYRRTQATSPQILARMSTPAPSLTPPCPSATRSTSSSLASRDLSKDV